MSGAAAREIKGWHVLAIFLGFFGVIIAVNVMLAVEAVSSFPGLEVENSYVASQTFDAERRAQEALGWTVTPSYDPARDRLDLRFAGASGAAVAVEGLDVLVGRTTEAAEDVRPVFVWQDGAYVAEVRLGPGKWMMAVSARAIDGTAFRQRLGLYVRR